MSFLPPLKHYHFVRQQVSELQLPAFFYDIWMFAHQQPANVGKEEAPFGVVGVGVCLWVFVVNSVVSSPFKNVILQVEGKTSSSDEIALQSGPSTNSLPVCAISGKENYSKLCQA